MRSRMICRSTGPPGTKCMIRNTAIVIPRNVGMINSRRLRKYWVTPAYVLLGRRHEGAAAAFGVLLPVPDFERPDGHLDRRIGERPLILTLQRRIDPPEPHHVG